MDSSAHQRIENLIEIAKRIVRYFRIIRAFYVNFGPRGMEGAPLFRAEHFVEEAQNLHDIIFNRSDPGLLDLICHLNPVKQTITTSVVEVEVSDSLYDFVDAAKSLFNWCESERWSFLKKSPATNDPLAESNHCPASTAASQIMAMAQEDEVPPFLHEFQITLDKLQERFLSLNPPAELVSQDSLDESLAVKIEDKEARRVEIYDLKHSRWVPKTIHQAECRALDVVIQLTSQGNRPANSELDLSGGGSARSNVEALKRLLKRETLFAHAIKPPGPERTGWAVLTLSELRRSEPS